MNWLRIRCIRLVFLFLLSWAAGYQMVPAADFRHAKQLYVPPTLIERQIRYLPLADEPSLTISPAAKQSHANTRPKQRCGYCLSLARIERKISTLLKDGRVADAYKVYTQAHKLYPKDRRLVYFFTNNSLIVAKKLSKRGKLDTATIAQNVLAARNIPAKKLLIALKNAQVKPHVKPASITLNNKVKTAPNQIPETRPDPQVTFRQKGLLCLSQKDYVGANHNLSQAVILNRQDKIAGQALIELWQRLVARMPNANNHLGLARAYQITGDLPAALAEYKEVVRLDPEHPNLPAARQSFKLAQAQEDAAALTQPTRLPDTRAFNLQDTHIFRADLPLIKSGSLLTSFPRLLSSSANFPLNNITNFTVFLRNQLLMQKQEVGELQKATSSLAASDSIATEQAAKESINSSRPSSGSVFGTQIEPKDLNFNTCVCLQLQGMDPKTKDVRLFVVLKNKADTALPLPSKLKAVIKYDNKRKTKVRVSFLDKLVPPHGEVHGVITVPYNKIASSANLVLPNLLPSSEATRDVKLSTSTLQE